MTSEPTAEEVTARGMKAMAMRVGMGGALAGMVGGALMIGLMMIVMGGEGSGYATPLNLGIPAFAKTIAPPLSMLPTMMLAMGIHLPAGMMEQLKPALESGQIPPAMMHQLGVMLAAMHMPAARMQDVGALMAGHASNSQLTDLLAELPATARHQVMDAMPVTASNIVLGTITHFALSIFLGAMFAMLIIGVGIERMGIAALRTAGGIMLASIAGAGLAYVVSRWLILPAIDPMMRLVPEGWFFISHLLFGLVVGVGVTLIASHEGLLQTGRESLRTARAAASRAD